MGAKKTHCSSHGACPVSPHPQAEAEVTFAQGWQRWCRAQRVPPGADTTPWAPWTYVQGTKLGPSSPSNNFNKHQPNSQMCLGVSVSRYHLRLPMRTLAHLWLLCSWVQKWTQRPWHRAGKLALCNAALCAGTASTALWRQKQLLPPPTQIPLLSLLFSRSSMTAGLCLMVWQSLVPHTPERQRNTLAFLPEPAMKGPHCVLLGRGRQAEG